MVAFSDLFTVPTKAQIKTRVISIALAAGLKATSFIPGGVSERWLEIIPRALFTFLSGPSTAAVRMMFLDLATDPGDPGDLSEDQTPRPGFLSALGEGWYGTTRGGQTYATTTVTITNSGSTTTDPISPFDLTFQRSTAGPDGGFPTYRNTADNSVYTDIGGTFTLAPGASKTIPIQCEQLGSYGSAAVGQISVVVTQSFGSLTASASAAAVGSDREDRDLYIARCRQAADAASPNGAADAYRYAATTASDGARLQRYDGSGEVGTTRVGVTKNSSTGTVNAYFADDDGPSDATDVDSANANIQGVVLGVITTPIGVVPDCVTYTGAAANAVNIGPLVGTAKIKAVAGLDSASLIASAQQAILDKMSGAGDFDGEGTFSRVPIGGYDPSGGTGYVYTSDIAGDIREAYTGLHAVVLTNPATSTTSLSEDEVPVLIALPTVTGAADNGGGLIRLTVGSISASGSGLATSQVVQVSGVKGCTEANGTWTITKINDTHIDLQGSSFVNAYTSGGMLSRIIITVVS